MDQSLPLAFSALAAGANAAVAGGMTRPESGQRAPSRIRSASAAFALAASFGIGVALAFSVGWLALDRAFTGRALTAFVYLVLAGTCAAGLALAAARILAQKPWSARFAAVLILLSAGTGAFATLLMAAQMAFSFHHLSEAPLHIILLILGILSAGALYGFLAVAGPLLIPLGLPLIALFALLIAPPR
jgi:hypothetical protein